MNERNTIWVSSNRALRIDVDHEALWLVRVNTTNQAEEATPIRGYPAGLVRALEKVLNYDQNFANAILGDPHALLSLTVSLEVNGDNRWLGIESQAHGYYIWQSRLTLTEGYQIIEVVSKHWHQE
jgi:hypothetical protein